MIIETQVICIKNYRRQKIKKMKIKYIQSKKLLNEIKKEIKNAPKNKKIILNKGIINIVERIFYFNQLEQQGLGLKILTPNQMLSRLPITLVQLKAAINSEKLKNEIKQLLDSLYRSKNLQNNYIKV